MTLRTRRLMCALIAACVLWSIGPQGCSTERDVATLFAPVDVGTLVVDGLLVVGRRMPDILLSRAGRPDVAFDFETRAEPGARLVVTRESTGDSAVYFESGRPGEYVTHAAWVVLPDEDYRLRIVTTHGELVYARTHTPPRLSISDWFLLGDDGQTVQRRLRTYGELGDSVYFAPENRFVYARGLIEGRFARPEVPGFQIGLTSIDLDSGFVIDPDFFDEDDFENISRNAVSPPVQATDGTVRLPWLAVAFSGRHIFRVFALDRNAYDLIRTLPPADGSAFAFGGNLGDRLERPEFHVEGGIGLFGSASADSIGFFVLGNQ